MTFENTNQGTENTNQNDASCINLKDNYNMKIDKKATINWILKYNRTPFPYSPQNAALKGMEPKQPGYFDGNYFKQLKWKEYQDWGSLEKDFQDKLIKKWHDDERIEGVGLNAGWNGEFYVAMIDFDSKNFDSPEALEQAISGWENRNPGLEMAPVSQTQSCGYRYYIGFESVPKNWSNTVSFTFSPGGGKSLGELMVGPGGLGIILGRGLKGYYLWKRNACGEIPVFQSPESIGLFEVVKNQKINSIYDNKNITEEALEALSFIPVSQFDNDYQGWINIGMACHSAGLSIDDWDSWSQGGKEYKDYKDIENHWKSFDSSGGITPATLFKAAKDNGWKPTKQQNSNHQQLGQKQLGNTISNPNRNSTTSTATKKKATAQEIKQAVRECEKILLDVVLDDIDKAIKIEEIKQELSVSNTLWQDLLSKINRGVCEKRLKLELKALLQSDDKIQREIELSRIAQKYRLNLNSLTKMLKEMEVKITTPEYESMDFEELFNMGSKAVDYLIPGLLPKGESALLVAMPKVGKSLLAVDVAFAVATGEDGFLGETCATGRVLYVSVDESRESVTRKMIKRGFRPCDKKSIRIVTTFSINQLPKLEAEIEAFKPSLVIIDSLKRITKGSEISENSAEFSDNVYSISELCNRYGAACLLIHHSNKNTDSIGVENVRGSTAIAGACSNTWILNRIGKPDPDNKNKTIYDPRDPKRTLYCFNRDSEGKTFSIELNPENNSWQLLGEMGIDEEEAERMKTTKSRILKVFEFNQKLYPQGLSGSFIFDCLDGQSPGEVSKGSMYTTLNRLVSEKIIGSKPAPGDKRYTLYFLPGYGQDVNPQQTPNQTQPNPEHTTNHQPDSTVEDSEKSTIPPLPPLCVSDVMQYAETNTQYGLQIDNIDPKLDNKYITPVDEKTPMLCISNSDTEGDTAHCITHNNDKGGGGVNFLNCEELKHTTDDICSMSPQPRPTEPQPEPIPPSEPKTLDFNLLNEGDILFDNLGQPHKLIKPVRGMWQSHRKDVYISRNDVTQGKYHRATVEDITKLIQKTIKGKNAVQAQWLCDVYGGDANSLMALAIDSNDSLIEIYDFDYWE